MMVEKRASWILDGCSMSPIERIPSLVDAHQRELAHDIRVWRPKDLILDEMFSMWAQE